MMSRYSKAAPIFRIWQIIALLIVLLPEALFGYPSGAGSCDADKPAVGGDHLDTYSGKRQIYGANLETGQVTVTIDGETLTPSTTKTLLTQKDYSLKIVTARPEGFKGVLLRLEVPGGGDTVGTVAALIPVNTSALKFTERCVAPIIGLTHVNNSSKPFVEAILRLDQAVTNAKLDVTLVGINDYRASLYGYDVFLFDFDGDSAPITATSPSSTGGGAIESSPSTASPTISVNLVNDITGTLAPYPSPSSDAFRLVWTIYSLSAACILIAGWRL